MKAKTLLLGLLAVTVPALLNTGCVKPRAATPPPADTELQSSIDATYALFCVTDAEVMSSFMAENYTTPRFYAPAPGSVGGLTTTANPDSDDLSMGFGLTTCMDGHLRDGSLYLKRDVNSQYNPNAIPNSKYYRRYGYAGRLTLSEYKVDGWRIVTTNDDNTTEGQECITTNILTSDNFATNRSSTNLSWHIKGNFKLTKGNDMMFCKIDLVKTLVNSSDPAVLPPSPISAINWPLAIVAYTGKITGFTPGNVPFTMTIDDKQPILRDFTCSPDRVSNVTVSGNTLSQQNSEFHPFIDGTAYFTTGNLYQREIYYGGSEAAGKGQCDNSGSIRIKGISYPVDFKK